jgi:predicted TIM-barrel fold metal-dependent hydrolase
MDFPKFKNKAIDIHSHFNHGVSGDDYTPAFDGLSVSTLDFMLSENARIGIEQVGYSTYASVLSSDNIAIENEYLKSVSKNTENIYQWVVVHPKQDETFKQAEEMLSSKKVLGIKIHSPMHKYDICEHADKIFSFADKMGAVVLMHPDKISAMPAFADKYPNMKLIIAHLGSRAHIDAIKAAKHGNIYTDTSGGLSSLNNVIEYAVASVGSEKILFGTDTYSPVFQYSRIALARISQTDKENILYKNATKLFPDTFGKSITPKRKKSDLKN